MTISEPLGITLKCAESYLKILTIPHNTVLQLQIGCNVFIGITKVLSRSEETNNCCSNVNDKIEIPELKKPFKQLRPF